MNVENNKMNEARRRFLKSSSTIALGGMSYSTFGYPNIVPARGKDNSLRVGLIGCGGRGTGAADNTLSADSGAVLYAMAEIFQDRLDSSLDTLKKIHGDRIQVDKSRQFVGFDAFQKLIDSGVDVVLLATTPAFRPEHLEACVDAGKHVFFEKPVAIDAPGIRKVIATAKKAKLKNLTLVSGLCFRHDLKTQTLFGKVLDGAIGEIKSISSIRYGGSLEGRAFPRQPGWTDMEYQVRTWYFHNWLSGDFNVEQFVHSMDMISWVMGENMPVEAIGTGGRQARTDEKFGNIYDHFDVSFWYENGVRGYASTRQQKGTAYKNVIEVAGTLGNAYYEANRRYEITGKNAWQFQGEGNKMMVEEHKVMYDSIHNNKGFNDGERAANSTMMAILQRMVAYSGQTILWQDAINSDIKLGPQSFSIDLKYDGPGVAIPGMTKVI